MASIKEKLLNDIQNMNDEDLLQEVYQLIQDIKGSTKVIALNKEQKQNIEEARLQYEKGEYTDSDTLFKALLDE